MRSHIQRVLVAAALVTAIGVTALAKPEMTPIRLECSVPPGVKTGDQVTTVITFRALAAVDRLAVTVAPFQGVEVLSDPTQAVFTAMKNGEGRQLSVTIRMTGEKYGSLAVTYQVLQGQQTSSGAQTIVYGG